jgi:hypothetical protein
MILASLLLFETTRNGEVIVEIFVAIDKRGTCLVAGARRDHRGSRFKPTPPKSRPELRRVTRGMNGVAKRKRQEIEGSEAEITESDDIRCLGSHDKPATPLGELTTLVAALKEVIEQQNRTIENIRNGLAEVKDQNGQLQNEVKSMRAQLETYSVSPPTTKSWASVAAARAENPGGLEVVLSLKGALGLKAYMPHRETHIHMAERRFGILGCRNALRRITIGGELQTIPGRREKALHGSENTRLRPLESRLQSFSLLKFVMSAFPRCSAYFRMLSLKPPRSCLFEIVNSTSRPPIPHTPVIVADPWAEY